MDKKTAVSAALVSAVMAGATVIVTASGASAAPVSCPGGTKPVVTQEHVEMLGRSEMATVTTCPPVKKQKVNGQIYGIIPAVGVDFRDDNGNRTSSGLGQRDQVEWTGERKLGNGTDGALIKVCQITQGVGGWGPLYEGWIPAKYTRNL